MTTYGLFFQPLLIQIIFLSSSSFIIDTCALLHGKRTLLTNGVLNCNFNYYDRRRFYCTTSEVLMTPSTHTRTRTHTHTHTHERSHTSIWNRPFGDVHVRTIKSKFHLLAKKEYDEWEAGDIQLDLQALRSAVAKSNADSDLDEKERIHLLNEFAKQRRELIPDVKRFVLRPLLFAACCMCLSTLSSSLLSISSISSVHGGGKDFYAFLGKVLKYFSRAFFGAMDASYYISIALPLLVYHCTKTKYMDQQKPERREPFVDIGNLVSSSADDEDCNDYSQCLLEHWISSIFFSTTLHGLMLLSSLLFYGRHYNLTPTLLKGSYTSALLFEFGLRLSRFTTRLGAAASIHQFPKLLYQLRRSNQPRPVALLPTIVNRLINTYLYVLPMGFAADIAQLCLFSFQAGETYAVKLNTVINNRQFFLSRMIYISLLLSIVVPVVHLIALKTIVRIGHFTNISLAMDQEKALELLNEKDTDGFKLRYKLQWRPPTRIFHSSRKLFRKFTLFVFTGWGDKASIVDSTVSSDASGSNSKEPLILTLLGKELDSNKNPKFINRKNWVPQSTKSMANIHQTNYINNNFDDPLGIAFQQTFGIGVSFDFDHNSKLEKGQSASIHRLRARAAKSAIKQYNQIPQKVEKQVQSIADNEIRAKAYAKLVQEKQNEVVEVALEISTLIPSNAPAPDGKDLDVFAMTQFEASKLDSVSLPWLQNSDAEESNTEDSIYDDPYLSVEDAFLHDLKRKSKQIELPDVESEDMFNSSKTVLT